jgi:hypothetical protein
MTTLNRLKRIESILVPPKRRIVAALCWGDRCREILWETGRNERVDRDVSSLPADVRIFEVDPDRDLAIVFLGTDGEPHLQLILGVSETEMFPPHPPGGESCDRDL